MKKFLICVLTLSCSVSFSGQDNQVVARPETAEVQIRKQIVVDDLERQIKEIRFAVVRVFMRHRIAAWLWKDGKDDIQRAEEFAVAAVDDLFKNRDHIPQVYFNALSSDLIALLERHAIDAAQMLREKYRVDPSTGLALSDSVLNQKDGEKIAVDSAIRLLGNHSGANLEIVALISRLKERRSPELFRLLAAVVQAKELGRIKFDANTMNLFAGYYIDSNVPVSLKDRFLAIAIDVSRKVSAIPDGDHEGFFHLLSRIIPFISAGGQDQLAEANVILAVLKTRASQESKEAQERNERIRNATDKLGASIKEAEQANNPAVKYDLYAGAAQLALKLNKFAFSVDLVEKTSEIELRASSVPSDVRTRWRDQFRMEVVEKALQANDAEAAIYVIRRIVDLPLRAESLRKLAIHYIEIRDMGSSQDVLDESFKLAAKMEITPQSISTLLKLIPVAQRIDGTQVSRIGELAAKNINSIPSLDIEDKPETGKYNDYLLSVMIINWNLLPSLSKLVKENRAEASNIIDRINKPEIRIVADFVLMTDSIAMLTKQLTMQAAQDDSKSTSYQ